ncbi:MAG: (2Fe-2S)-binding protein [Candidatus Thermoplasmatota archaeon]
MKKKEKQKAIVCRCEDITVEEVEKAIDEGFTDLQELRKKLRIGMGPCQGRVCLQIVKKILKRKTGEKVSRDSWETYRPPVVPVSLGSLAAGDKDEKKEED